MIFLKKLLKINGYPIDNSNLEDDSTNLIKFILSHILLVKKCFFINTLDPKLGYMAIACEPTTYEDVVNESIRHKEYMITTLKIKRVRPFESMKSNAESFNKE